MIIKDAEKRHRQNNRNRKTAKDRWRRKYRQRRKQRQPESSKGSKKKDRQSQTGGTERGAARARQERVAAKSNKNATRGRLGGSLALEIDFLLNSLRWPYFLSRSNTTQPRLPTTNHDGGRTAEHA